MGCMGKILIWASVYRLKGNAYLQLVIDLDGSLPLAFLAAISLLDEIARTPTVVTC